MLVVEAEGIDNGRSGTDVENRMVRPSGGREDVAIFLMHQRLDWSERKVKRGWMMLWLELKLELPFESLLLMTEPQLEPHLSPPFPKVGYC